MSLAAVCSTLCVLCAIHVQSYLEAELSCEEIEKKNRRDAMKLYALVKKNYNWSTTVVLDDMIRNLVQGIFDFTLVRDDKYDSLPKYLNAYKHKHEMFGAGFELANNKLRDLCIGELISRE